MKLSLVVLTPGGSDLHDGSRKIIGSYYHNAGEQKHIGKSLQDVVPGKITVCFCVLSKLFTTEKKRVEFISEKNPRSHVKCRYELAYQCTKHQSFGSQSVQQYGKTSIRTGLQYSYYSETIASINDNFWIFLNNWFLS